VFDRCDQLNKTAKNGKRFKRGLHAREPHRCAIARFRHCVERFGLGTNARLSAASAARQTGEHAKTIDRPSTYNNNTGILGRGLTGVNVGLSWPRLRSREVARIGEIAVVAEVAGKAACREEWNGANCRRSKHTAEER